MFKHILTLSLALAAVIVANPSPANLEERANCNAVSGALLVLKPLGAPATSFCSSYLKIPATSTVLSTTQPAPVLVAIPSF